MIGEFISFLLCRLYWTLSDFCNQLVKARVEAEFPITKAFNCVSKDSGVVHAISKDYPYDVERKLGLRYVHSTMKDFRIRILEVS